MSLLFMVLLLVGVVLVLGGGSYAVRRIIASLEERLAAGRVPDIDPSERPEPQVGGYVPGPRNPEDLPPSLRARVRNLVSLDRTEEAVRIVSERVDVDEERARGIVADLGGGSGPGRALDA
ncbi:hypothetical protein [Nocardiopsis sp. FIRDI 009]|uniref:hypothetical protein n=1 Tax=Nocardiopsis sp. FIRDI 009 TaxID=714197 RepID=UPI000E245986|nr:hypothetical protein [Nocardiopsis sp. FIRDI 009]